MKTKLERGMKMKRKNGFTLIELLAVIVILAIIALIAVPVVMNIISKANKSAFKDSAYGILKAGELFYTDKLLEAQGMTEDKTFIFPNDIEGLEINGSKPTGGSMTVNKKGQIAMEIHNGKHCVTKAFEDDDVTITDDVTNCELGPKVNTLTTLATTYSFKKVDDEANATATAEEVTVPSCITNKIKCNAGTPVAVEVAPNLVYKFYVLNDDTTKNEVTLIMDRNLGENVAWISANDYKDNDGCTYSACNDQGPLTALAILKERTRGWTNIPVYSYNLKNEIIPEWGENTYPDINGELVTNVRARMPKVSDIIEFGIELDHYEVPVGLPSWLHENLYYSGAENVRGYWLSVTSSATDYFAYYVDNGGCDGCGGRVGGTNVDYDFYVSSAEAGVRPIITLSK